jgi:hypothetical protein
MRRLFFEIRAEAERALKQDLPRRWQQMALASILLVCAAARFGPTQHPPLDRTVWKEIDHIEISKNYWHHGMHFLRPEITWPAETPRVTAMEFPLVPFLAATLYEMFGLHPFTVRLVPCVAYLAMASYVFLLVRREAGPALGLVSALAAALMPIHHQFGRILFSEPLSIATSVGALYHFDTWVDSRKLKDGVFAFLCFTVAVALKLEPLFLLLPLLWLWYRRHGLRIREYGAFAGFVALVLILPIAWYSYAFYLSRTSIDVFGVVPFMQGHDKLQTLTMIRNPRFFVAIGHRIWDLAWGFSGAPLLVLGVVISLTIRTLRLFHVYLLAIGIYFLIVAEGQLDTSYRQLNSVPVVSVFVALAVLSLCGFVLSRWRSGGGYLPNKLTICALLLIALASVPSYIKLLLMNPDSPAHPLAWTLAQEIRRNAGPNDRLVMLGEYDVHVGGNDLSPVTYYYSGLRGWTLQQRDLSIERTQDLMRRGATLLAVTREFGSVDLSHDQAMCAFVEKIRARYKLLYEENGQLLFRLGGKWGR